MKRLLFVSCVLSSVIFSDVANSQPGASMQQAPASGDVPAKASVSNKKVLPLDHGPHAVTTPWSNQQRLASNKANELVDSRQPSTPSASPDNTVK
ncbi:MAG: hypothetical protein IV101_03740 [Dechloromonas sp.]|uniref:hypothetical protein n=1 Tax=Dechloromonas sp. TaxID=1917218 RepID=UPI0027FA422D|nr:hypothetical protein [Dechloromonas sp.]MBT9519985.1 hypothetical protein [Dechloromonas sp.]